MTPGIRERPFAVLVVASLVAAAVTARAQVGASLEGFTGQLTTPSAWTAPSGTALLVFTNAEEPGLRDRTSSRSATLTAGLLGWVEAGGRLTEVRPDPQLRDLSFHLKLRLPLERVLPGAPFALAVGAQDEGGAAAVLETRYAVASARLWRLTGSVGYGTGPDRMEGWFGGGTVRLSSWLDAVGDWDGDDLNAGLRASVPLARVGLPFRVGGIVRGVVSERPVPLEWGVTLEVPLWLNAGPEGRRFAERGAPHGAATAPPPPPPRAEAASTVVSAIAGAPLDEARAASVAPAQAQPPPEPPLEALRALEDALVEAGLEEVRAGRAGAGVVLEYENNRFNHAEADALHVVLREVDRVGLAGRALAIVVKRSGLRVAEIAVPAKGDADAIAAVGAAPRWRSAPGVRAAEWASASPRNRRALHSTLVLAPGLRSFVGTEVGVVDWLVTFRPDLIVPLWPGATGFGRAEIPLAWSDDLEDGRPYRRYRNPARLEYATLHQAVPLAPGLWVMVGGGVIRATDAGGIGEALWTGAGGALALGVQGSWTIDNDYVETKALTGSARLRVAPLDATLLVRGGRFVGGDRGLTLELSRWFGDTQIGVFYTRTTTELAGAFFTIPLTLRRDMRPGWLQVRGPKRWGHGLGSVVGQQFNFVTTGLAAAPLGPWNLESSYLDGGRVSSDGLVEPVRGLPALAR